MNDHISALHETTWKGAVLIRFLATAEARPLLENIDAQARDDIQRQVSVTEDACEQADSALLWANNMVGALQKELGNHPALCMALVRHLQEIHGAIDTSLWDQEACAQLLWVFQRAQHQRDGEASGEEEPRR